MAHFQAGQRAVRRGGLPLTRTLPLTLTLTLSLNQVQLDLHGPAALALHPGANGLWAYHPSSEALTLYTAPEAALEGLPPIPILAQSQTQTQTLILTLVLTLTLT